ncbi:putative harbinger transposase-derived protein [Helianthus annuus]|nr:putative harbinger transposase-derived protein [Helianthus annuus]
MRMMFNSCTKLMKHDTGFRECSVALILEAVASQDLWICHSFFGLPGSLNDLNVLYQCAIIEQPAHVFTPKRLRLCMYACILLHNMIIEDEGRAIYEHDENASIGNTIPVDPTQQDLKSFSLTNDFTHANLQQDLVERIWNNANGGDGDEDEDDSE